MTEYFVPGDYTQINEGVSLMGHLLADLFIQSSFGHMGMTFHDEDPDDLGKNPVDVELPIDWKHGVTRLDAVVWSGPYAGHFEVKTSSDKSPRPSKDNRSQVIRQRAVASRFLGMELPQSYVVIIGKSGLLSCYSYGPFPITPTDEEVEQADEELALIDLVMDDLLQVSGAVDPRDHPLARELCRCSACFPPTREEADALLREMLDNEYDDAVQAGNERLRKELAAQVKEHVEPGQSLQSGRWVATRSDKNGRLTITARKD
jgi:hypothetical protein